MPRKKPSRSFSAVEGSIFQIKIRLLGISPMIWRRLLVPASCTLHELHGVIQAVMGWEGLHLFQFKVRAVAYGSFDLMVEDPAVPLESFGFRKNTKLAYIYDMGAWWEHELRIEDRLEAVVGKRYPICIGGSGACPPEDCGGPGGFLARCDEASGYDAWQDASIIAEWLGDVAINRNAEVMKDRERLDELEQAAERMAARKPYLSDQFSRAKANARFREDEHRRLMHQWF